jgi:hypothetical protein
MGHGNDFPQMSIGKDSEMEMKQGLSQPPTDSSPSLPSQCYVVNAKALPGLTTIDPTTLMSTTNGTSDSV